MARPFRLLSLTTKPCSSPTTLPRLPVPGPVSADAYAQSFDLASEFRCLTNGLSVPCGNGLLGAVRLRSGRRCHRREAEMQQLALRGGEYTEAERQAPLEEGVCPSDVDSFSHFSCHVAGNRPTAALLRGRYMASAGGMERRLHRHEDSSRHPVELGVNQIPSHSRSGQKLWRFCSHRATSYQSRIPIRCRLAPGGRRQRHRPVSSGGCRRFGMARERPKQTPRYSPPGRQHGGKQG